jgi:hypothetical protein
MKRLRRLSLAAAMLGLLAAAGPAKAGTSVSFDSSGDVALSPTPAPGTWFPDRYAPNGFASGEAGVLTESISSNDAAAIPALPFMYSTTGVCNVICIETISQGIWQGFLTA